MVVDFLRPKAVAVRRRQALVVPPAVAGKPWLGDLTPLLRLGLTNSVVIATVFGIGLTLLVGRGGDSS